MISRRCLILLWRVDSLETIVHLCIDLSEHEDGNAMSQPAAGTQRNSRPCFCIVVAVVLVRTAWTCDDAHITFRVVDNFYMAMVCAGTSPSGCRGIRILWLFCLIPCAVIGHLPYCHVTGYRADAVTLYLLLTKVIHSAGCDSGFSDVAVFQSILDIPPPVWRTLTYLLAALVRTAIIDPDGTQFFVSLLTALRG